MHYDENLAKFLANKNLNTLYTDFLGQKIFILNADKIYIFGFEENQIYKLENCEFQNYQFEDFIALIRLNIEECKANNFHFESILEHKENVLLKGILIKHFFKKIFILKQKINKNIKTLNLLSEALNLLISEQNFCKKALKPLLLSTNISLRTAKESLNRLNEMYSLVSAMKNERMNKSIYFLSVLSAIFLPLNLIVGFFGMNTEGLFFDGNKNGTWYIFSTICFILIFGLIFYKNKKEKELDFDDKITKKSKK
ncbi:CorA family divalent cation transporter [Campylobacter sp. US33a]|uniref:CorA family divalent cation transporter n=1 Tax=Campylobacter sp. CCS1377 TaxID=3158229 RepID=A0AAU7E6Q7_9BACT|nr:CorA family divalent cation transporter [Campylobacter sp. US33a]TEY01159.1 magnesium transporter CorA family protein [Campylobacter sp. US33a]